jgi:PiT family inorganic phosphate transporter
MPRLVGSELLLVIVVVTALAFDFTNGFHDTANAMATSIATGIVDAKALTLTMVFAALIGAIAWNLVTWALSLPSSSSHALVGGVVGAAIAAGTYIGGWRIINTMGNRLTEIEAPQGFAAESSGASVILASSYFGYPLSTTHVVSGALVGSGVGKRLASVQWGTAGQMASAWLLTIPGAAIIGAAAFEGLICSARATWGR